MSNSTFNGHKIEHNGIEWIFSDSKESTIATFKERPCGNCSKQPIKDGVESYDACIGKVEGLINACCGHGDSSNAYAQFPDGSVLKGEDAVNYFNSKKEERNRCH